MSDEKKLKPVPAEFQELSGVMMALHQASASVSELAAQALVLTRACVPIIVSGSGGKFLVADAGSAQADLARLTAIEFDTRATHSKMSEILRKNGYELPVVMTRGGPGGR